MTAGPATVFLCSPRAGGNSDAAGLAFAAGLTGAGHAPRIIRLRDYAVAPCRGCGACSAGPEHRCPLAGDDAEALFAAILDASVLVFAAPIFFYHLPAQLKGLIDRAQRYYARRVAREAAGWVAPAERPAEVVLVSGRREGKQLFAGALLTFTYFLWPFAVRLGDDPCLLRGYDAPGDLAADARALADLAARGARAGAGKK